MGKHVLHAELNNGNKTGINCFQMETMLRFNGLLLHHEADIGRMISTGNDPS